VRGFLWGSHNDQWLPKASSCCTLQHMIRKSTPYRFALILIIAVTACLLLALSWPRLRASVRYLPVDTAISNYWKTLEFDYAQLGGLIERAGESIAIHDHYRYWEGLSELQILGGQDMSQSFWVRRQALEKSISAAEQAVQRAPAKPRTWLRIARAKEFLAYPAEEIIPALKMSILTGRVEPTLMLTRLELGLRYLPAMDDEAVRLLRDQAMLTWSIQKRPMIKRIESGSLGPALLRGLLDGSDPAIIAEMEAYFVE
jgi:hypothetical protein